MKKVFVLFFILYGLTFSAEKDFMPPHPKLIENGIITRAGERSYNIKKDTVRITDKAITVVGEADVRPKILVLLVEFEEEEINGETIGKHDPLKDKAYYEDLVGTQMKEYYHEVSYEKYDFEVEVRDWVTVENTYSTDINKNKMSYFGEDKTGIDDGGNGERLRELVKSAIRQNFDINLDGVESLDFKSLYDGNPVDGYLDHLIIVHAGSGQEETGITSEIWSHRWDIASTLTYEGESPISFFNYTMQAEDSGLGIFAHEFGHDLGLVDLYNTQTGSSVVGSYSLMDKGSWNGEAGYAETPAHMSAWEKLILGWVEAIDINIGGNYTLKALEKLLSETDNLADNETYVYRIYLDSTKLDYLVMEYREKKGYDSYIAGNGGILIYHVYEKEIGSQSFEESMDSNNINANSILKRYKVLEADGSNNLGGANVGEDGDYYKNNNYGLYPYANNKTNSCYWEWTTPFTLGAYSGNSGVIIKNFLSNELSGNIMTFELEIENYTIKTSLGNGMKTFESMFSFDFEVSDNIGEAINYIISLNGKELEKTSDYTVALEEGINEIKIILENGDIKTYAITLLSVDLVKDNVFNGLDVKQYIIEYNLVDNSKWDIDGDSDVDTEDFQKFRDGIQKQYKNLKFW